MRKSILKHNPTRSITLMLQGTSSHVGKSVITAALCRILKKKGFKAAPFKAQNMALNSFVTTDGGEIGRAQAHQAEAAGIEPNSDMNPILLKPTDDRKAQVIIQGRVHGVMSASQYHGFKKEARKYVLESFQRLSSIYNIIVIEGAGSPAEINLRENDIANMGAAKLTNSPVVIIGDIDRGGVFASLVGTMELLTKDERKRVAGFIINKFRGDMSLLMPGISYLEKRTGLPVLGVIPYLRDMALPDEDSVSLDGRGGRGKNPGRLKISVVKLPRISNFTDFDPLKADAGIELRYIERPEDVSGSCMVIIPGSKNTVKDLLWLKEKGLHKAIKRFYENGGHVAGICGGYQMLGKSIRDPHGAESVVKSAEGLCLLDAKTVLKKEKKTCQVEGRARDPLTKKAFDIKGYEVHMGDTVSAGPPFARITRKGQAACVVKDGAVSLDGRVWGTYIHGIFDNDGLRSSILKGLGQKGAGKQEKKKFSRVREASLSRLSSAVEKSLDMKRLFKIMGI
ncbi:MAG: cobyric acid synthase [Deltaproteobacteria bacterium]|nr:cobyric acid synthase [Deltaproteobacteria bacterium]